MAWFRFPWQSGKSTRAHKKAQNNRPRPRRLYPTFEQLEIRWLPANTGGISEFALTAGSAPWDITSGPDGNLWFTENGTNKVAKITTAGTVTEYTVPTSSSAPEGICLGPDGNLWFTENSTNKIAKVTTSGTFTEYTVPTSSSGPAEITAGPDGNLWFTENSTNKIGMVTTSGSFTEYSVPTSSSAPLGITAAPDGNLWFAENGTSKLARVTTSGTFTEYATPSSSTQPWGITVGPDGNVWSSENQGNALVQVSLRSSALAELATAANANPTGITAGSDGNLWYAESGAGKIGRMTTTGTANDYLLGPARGPHGVTAGPDRAIWVTEKDADKIGTIGSVVAAQARVVDPAQALYTPFGDAGISPETGGVLLSNPLDYSQGGVGVGVSPALVYRSDTVNILPVIEQAMASFGSTVPTQINVTLTWNNGSPQTQVVFQTTGHSAGDIYLLSQQVSSAVTSTGYYPWELDTTAVYAGGNVSRTAAGFAAVDAQGSSDPFGYGWGVAGLDSLQSVSGGVLWIYGSGGARYFKSAGSGTYLSPANDFGTLVQNNDSSYTYTAKDQTQTFFNSSGVETKVVDTHLRTLTYTYSSGRLSTVASPDGGVTTFHYDGSNLLDKITEPGNRVVTVAHNGSSDLTSITNPDGALHTFTYNGSHQVTNEQWGSQSATYAYDGTYNRLSSVDRGAGLTLTVTPEINQGLATSPAKNASQGVGVLTDALSHSTTFSLDAAARLTKPVTADGASQNYQLDFSGQSASVTDQLSNVTTYAYQYGASDGDVTKITNPDGSTQQFQYDGTFHEPTVQIDGNGDRTTMGYDATSGDVTTITTAAGTTTLTYYQSGGQSNGLVLNERDPLGNVTSFAYDSAGRETTEIRGYGTSVATTATMIYDNSGNLLSETIGQSTTAAYNHAETTSYAYDSLRRVTQRIEAYGAAEQRSSSTIFDAQGNVLSTTDPNGNVVSYAYDAQGRQTKVITGYGTAQAVTATMLYDSAGNILSETTGQSTTASYNQASTVSYAYDSVNRQTKQIQGYGTSVAATATMVYDSAGNLLSESTGQSSTASYDHSATTSYAYDSLNRQVKVITGYGTAQAVTATMIYDSAGNLLSETTGQSTTAAYNHPATTSYAFDAANRNVATIEAFGAAGLQRSSTIVYDAAGNVLSRIDPLGHTTSFAYNALNQQTTVIQAYGTSVAVTGTMIYDGSGNLLSETDGASTTAAYNHASTTSYAYNALNEQTQVLRAYGQPEQTTSTAIYDPAGNLLSQTTGYSATATYTHSATSSYSYDALNRRVASIDAYGVGGVQRTATVVYDAAGNAQVRLDALGNAVTMAYDALNREVSSQNAVGIATTVYDAAGNVVNTIDANNEKSTFVYDALNSQTSSTDPRGGVTTNVFDAAGNKVSLTDPDNNTTTFTLDTLNRVTQQTDPLTHSSTFAYSATGKLTSTTDALGRVRNLSYDGLDRQIGETWVTSGSTVNTLTFTYDAASNQLTAADQNGAYTFAYDALNRPTSQKDVNNLLLTYTYDAASNTILRQDSKFGVLTSVYDALNRLTSRQFGGPSQTTLRIDPTWTARDQLQGLTRYSDLNGSTVVGTSSYAYDAAMRLTNLQHKDAGGNSIASYVYSYDAGNRLTVEKLNGALTSYGYDLSSQLTTVVTGSGTTTYGYDANGNRTSTGYTTGTDNQLTNDGTWTYTYDLAGNLQQKAKGSNSEVVTYTYDHLNHLLSVSDYTTGNGVYTTTYKYDVLGNRIEAKQTPPVGPAAITDFGYDAQNAWVDLDGSGNLTMRRLYLNGVDQLFARISSGGTAAWYLTDRLYSTRDIENYSGTAALDHVDYDGFGSVTNETQVANGDRYKYTGRELDSETGLQYNRSRSYAPSQGRWIQEDPMGFAAGDTNLYRYVNNDVTFATDPSGLSPADIIVPPSLLGSYAVNDLGERKLNSLAPPARFDVDEVKSWLNAVTKRLATAPGDLALFTAYNAIKISNLSLHISDTIKDDKIESVSAYWKGTLKNEIVLPGFEVFGKAVDLVGYEVSPSPPKIVAEEITNKGPVPHAEVTVQFNVDATIGVFKGKASIVVGPIDFTFREQGTWAWTGGFRGPESRP